MNKRHYKREVVRINLSTPFITRTRCKHCGELPAIYYYIYNTTLWGSPVSIQKMFAMISKRVTRMGTSHYLKDNPSDYSGLSNFSQGTGFRRYIPRLRHTRGINQDFDVTEYLMCPCAKSMYAFTQKSVKGRPEIINRKSRKCYPKKFLF